MPAAYLGFAFNASRSLGICVLIRYVFAFSCFFVAVSFIALYRGQLKKSDSLCSGPLLRRLIKEALIRRPYSGGLNKAPGGRSTPLGFQNWGAPPLPLPPGFSKLPGAPPPNPHLGDFQNLILGSGEPAQEFKHFIDFLLPASLPGSILIRPLGAL